MIRLFLKVVNWTVWLIQVNPVLWIILWISIRLFVEKPTYLLFLIPIPILHCELLFLFLYLIHPLFPFLRLASNKLKHILILYNLPVLHLRLCLEQPLQEISFLMQEVGDGLLRILLNPVWLLQAFGDLELELALQYLFLLAYLVDDQCLVVELDHVQTPLVFVIWNCQSLSLVFYLFNSTLG